MTTLDELARRAAGQLRDDADRLAGPEIGRRLDAAGVPGRGRPHRRWVAMVAAAALVVGAIGAVVWTRGDDAAVTDTIPGSSAAPVTVDAVAPTVPVTVEPAVEVTAGVTGPAATDPPGPSTTAVTLAEGAASPGGAVSYLDPPPELRLHELATLPIGDVGRAAAILPEGGAVLFDSGRNVLVVVDATGGVEREVALDARELPDGVFNVIGGPDGVLYAIDGHLAPTGTTRIVAIPLAGADAGTVIGEQPIAVTAVISEVGPGGQLGQGRDGIVDRQTGEVVIPYVGGATVDVEGYVYDERSATVRRRDSSVAWAFDIERIATAMDTYTGDVPPAPLAGGGARFWTAIGPYGEAGGDFPPTTMPVLAFLQPDGSVEWNSIPEGWEIVSSELAGTLLIRWDETSVTLASAIPASASVRVSRGGAATDQPGCTADSCEFLVVELHGFVPGVYEVACFAEGQEFSMGVMRLSEAGGEIGCYYGFPGDEVWVEVGGVRSDAIVW